MTTVATTADGTMALIAATTTTAAAVAATAAEEGSGGGGAGSTGMDDVSGVSVDANALKHLLA